MTPGLQSGYKLSLTEFMDRRLGWNSEALLVRKMGNGEFQL